MNPSMILGLILVGSLLVNFFLGYMLSETNSVVEQVERANDEWVNVIAMKEEEMTGIAKQCEIITDHFKALDEENTRLREETDDAKRKLKQKNITGNFSSWIKTDPSGFRDSATNGSNRVLANIVEISAGGESPSGSRSSTKGSMSDAIGSTDTGTGIDVAPGAGIMD